MSKNQKINCTVASCKYNNGEANLCELEQIIVKPVKDCCSTKPDESKCGSYKHHTL